MELKLKGALSLTAAWVVKQVPEWVNIGVGSKRAPQHFRSGGYPESEKRNLP